MALAALLQERISVLFMDGLILKRERCVNLLVNKPKLVVNANSYTIGVARPSEVAPIV